MKTRALALYLLAGQALAEPAARPVATGLSGGSALLQMLLNLALVLGMILLAAWLYRKLNRLQARAAGGQWMQIRASLPLGLREKLVLVQVGQEYLVLGVTQQRMECLARMQNLQPLEEADFASVLKAHSTEKHQEEKA